MSDNDFVTCVRLVSTLIHADEIVHERERIFLDRLADSMHFTPAEREAAKVPVDEETGVALLRELAQPIREGLLRTLMRVAMADGEVHDRERALIARMAQAIGVRESTLERLWTGLKQHSPVDDE